MQRAAPQHEEYGLVIHEFDPWFNYRAAEYLAANGWQRWRGGETSGILAHRHVHMSIFLHTSAPFHTDA